MLLDIESKQNDMEEKRNFLILVNVCVYGNSLMA